MIILGIGYLEKQSLITRCFRGDIMTQGMYWILALILTSISVAVSVATFIVGKKKGRSDAEKDLSRRSYEEGQEDMKMAMQVSNTAKDVSEIKLMLKEFDFGEYKMRIKQLEMAVFGECKDVKKST